MRNRFATLQRSIPQLRVRTRHGMVRHMSISAPLPRRAFCAGGLSFAMAGPALAGTDGIASRIFAASNAARAAKGLAPLTFHTGLARAAQPLADAILASRRLSHGADGRDLAGRARAARYPYRRLAENIAWMTRAGDDQTMGDQFVALWLGSRGHRANLLDGGLRDIGVAVAINARDVAAVQVFGRSR